MMLEVEKEKQILQENSYRYSEMVKQLNDVEGYINKYIKELKQKMVGKDFKDEESFNEYIDDATALKKLENQKKYLSRG